MQWLRSNLIFAASYQIDLHINEKSHSAAQVTLSFSTLHAKLDHRLVNALTFFLWTDQMV